MTEFLDLETLTLLKVVCLLVAYFISLGLAWHCGSLYTLAVLDKKEEEQDNEMLEEMYEMMLQEQEEKKMSREQFFRELTSPCRPYLEDDDYGNEE